MAQKIHKIQNSHIHSDLDQEAYFEKVYREYFKRLYAYAKAIVDSQSLAKDIVSDLFYGLWKNKANLYEIDDLEVYLFVSVRNQSLQSLKKSSHIQTMEAIDAKYESIDYINPEELLLEKELLAALEKIISELPEQCQLIFRLFRERGLKNAEIAEELGISVVTVKSQKRKAQIKLKAGILKYYHDSEGVHLPDIRLISQYLLALGFINYDFIN
ncbi:MAG: RNA polymerase sigma-70 factor [Cyclobacteriaceae bacterium]